MVISKDKFPATGPGILTVWQERLAVVEDLELNPGGTVKVDVGSLETPVYIAAYLDENKDFMGTCHPGPGEYYTSQLLVAGKGKKLFARLDARKKPRTPPTVSWLKEHSFISSKMLDAGFGRDEATLKFLVGLPPGYWQTDKTYPVLFVSHGFSGNRWVYLNRYRQWRKMMADKPMILVSLDSNSRFGHHLFLNSEANGPRFDVLTKELVPYIDHYFRSNGKRVIYGQSSGGWTAISALQKAPQLFSGAVATGPDPLVLDSWWFGTSGNAFVKSDGSLRMLCPDYGLSMKSMVETEVITNSYGQYSAFMACFSPFQPDRPGLPFLSPFDPKTGAKDPEVWDIWKGYEMDGWVRAHPEQARETFSNRLVLFVGEKDEFGLRETTQQFSKTLEELHIPHRYQEIPGAGHTNYLEKPDFVKTCWDLFFELAG